jgi:TonB family protein
MALLGVGNSAIARADAIAAPPLNCARSVVEPVGRYLASPSYPDSALGLAIGTVTVVVDVTLNADGSVASTLVAKSSGTPAIDVAALQAARSSTYAPKFINCVATDGGVYIFKVEFDGAGAARVLGCDKPFRSVTMSSAVAPALPSGLNIPKPVAVLVDVLVGQDGSLRGATIAMSSGIAAVDQAVVRAALASTYAPKLVNCEPTQGDFLYRADFNATAPAPSASPV